MRFPEVKMKNNKVLIITDSISMPRPGVSYEETWIYLLKKKYRNLDIIDRPARGSTSRRLVTEGGGGVDLLETYMPGTVIMQIGLTECAPRLFRKKGVEFFFMNKILTPQLRTRYINHVKKTRQRKPELSDVSPDEFRINFRKFFLRCQKTGTKVIVIKILKATNLYLSKSPGIQQSLDLYNDIYDELAGEFSDIVVISPVKDSMDVDRLCIDELHINKEGHRIYFNAVNSCFRKLYPSS
mgnify:FL=1